MAMPTTDRLGSSLPLLRAGLAVFVLVWIFGPYELRSAVPIWLPFAIALGLELNFFLGALRSPSPRGRSRGPQPVDRERFGYPEDVDELLLVREGGEELWLPYSGETAEEVEELVAEARERAAAAREAPPAVLAAPPRRLPIRRFLVGLGVIAALALVVWFVDSRSGWSGLSAGTRAEAAERFSAEASRIAGHPVTIRCDESGDYVGAVQHAEGVAAVGGDLAYLAPTRCHDLYRLAFEGEVSFSQTARAIAVLAHEAWHLRGVRDEGRTECYALQSGVELGRRLGLSERTARRMMRQQLAENQLRGGASVEYLVPAECRDGGALDLHPGSSRFP
jgi:hypothetical protein